MIIITGSILARPETFNELRRICVEHTRRSRTEQGCEHHSVHIDAENGLRLVFLERWSGRTAVLAHFAEPNARAFVARARTLAAEAPTLNIYTSEEIDVAALAGR
jgi:quinol monooxygenase YgiN